MNEIPGKRWFKKLDIAISYMMAIDARTLSLVISEYLERTYFGIFRLSDMGILLCKYEPLINAALRTNIWITDALALLPIV
ncbi:hypothetical protein GcM3_191029 [Golovinomyces cichoracearum]|uniref:Uncharacterized protein n=1 Tax=Golovinomyces cichoracearum TaxID=62708 RepID=A0A420HI31_9PEZI|nr:hypothetical protein GcM3_191029 [Golovinomyces cichoracearum]